MKKKTLALVLAFTMTAALFTGCGSKKETETTQPQTETAAETESEEVDDQAAADEVAALIDAIYVQTRNENTDEQCAAAKAAWDKLTDAQKELVEGENADPDYFGRDTGDASKDDPLNEDGIGENELLVVSFGTSFNDSRAEDIGGVEKALQEANQRIEQERRQVCADAQEQLPQLVSILAQQLLSGDTGGEER